VTTHLSPQHLLVSDAPLKLRYRVPAIRVVIMPFLSFASLSGSLLFLIFAYFPPIAGSPPAAQIRSALQSLPWQLENDVTPAKNLPETMLGGLPSSTTTATAPSPASP
jgi:hypothetical protein